jgi:hypothetical protein
MENPGSKEKFYSIPGRKIEKNEKPSEIHLFRNMILSGTLKKFE